MGELNLTDQLSKNLPIKQRQAELEELLSQRLGLWSGLSVEERRRWLDGGQDPILSAAYLHYLKLGEFFAGIDIGA